MKIIALVALFALTHVCGQATTHTYPATFVPPYQLKCTSTQTGLAATQYIPTVTTTADVQIGTTSYGNYASTASTSRAVLGLDATGILAFVAGEDSAAPSGTDAAQVTNVVNKIKTVGTVTNEVQSQTTTWIPGATAVEYTADLSITQTPRSLIESIANAVFGTSTYSWSTTADGASTSSWKLQFFFVHHTTPSPMWTYTISVSSAATWNYGTGAYGHGAAYFEFSDLLYGNSFATSTYVLGDYCDRFLTTGVKPIDIIFTVDNSGSMGAHQDAVAQLGTVIQAQLANAGIDWRIALVTSSFYYNYYSNNACDGRTCTNSKTSLCRYFTRDIAVVQSWLQQTQPSTWIGAGGTCGNSNERCVYSMQLFLSAAPKVGTTNLAHVWPPTSPEDSTFLRTNINLVLIVLGDADDQQYSSASTCTGASGSQCGILSYVAFYAGIRAALQDGLFLGGIICPTTSVCSETQNSPRVTRGWLEDPSSQAVIGSIVDTPSIQTTVLAIFNKILAASSPYKLSKNNALASSIQVLMSPSDTLGNCIVQYNNVATNEIPRSISNGFDYRSGNVVLYGNCRPNKDNANLIVNYKYWLKAVCGDGLVQSNEQCDPNATSTSTSPACCSSTCQLLPAGTPCVAGGTCTGLSNVCDASGTCVVSSCPPVQNYCDVFINCDVNGCHYQNRSCLPVNCFKRTCDRTAINTAHTFANGTQMPGDCVFVQIETGYQCDTVYCTIDACGVCQGDNSTCKDCRGVPNGGLSYDVCGICGGNGQSCIGCDGVLFGPKRDSCGVCGGNNLSCVSCTLVPGGQIGVDACGVCQGDGKSCLPTYDFVVSVPAGTALDCTTAIAQATASLIAAGKSPTTEQVQCDVMPVGCTGESNYLTYCNSTLVQVIVKIRQDVWNGTSVTAATQLATLNAAPSSFTTNLATTLGIPTTSISAVAVYTAPVPTSASGSPSASGGTASGSVSGGSGSVSASGSVSGSVGSASSGSVSGGGSSSPATSATSSIPPTQAQGYTVTVPAINDPTVLANAQSALQAAIAQQYPAAVFTITSTTSNGNTVFTVTFDTTAGTVPNLAQFQQTVTNNVAPTWTSSGAIPAGTTPAVEPAVIAATTDASLALPMLLSLLL